MKKKDSSFRLISIFLIVSLVSQPTAFAVEEIKPFLTLLEKDRVNLSYSIPSSVAKIEDSYQAPGSGKTIFLIQDAHTNESGQLNLAKALEVILTHEKGIQTVFTEGAVGDNSLSFLRSAKPFKERRDLAQSYIRKGLLHGAEYLDLTSDLNFKIWGVENPDLYIQSLENYRAVAKDRERFSLYLKKISATYESISSKQLSPLLKTRIEQSEQYHTGKIPLTAYFESLSKEASKLDVSMSEFKHLSGLNELKDRESKINFEKANQEQLRAIGSLSVEDQKLIKESSAKAGPSKGSKTEEDVTSGYFSLLHEKLSGKESEFQELFKYFEYLKLAGQIEAPMLLQEMGRFESAVMDAASLSSEDKAFVKIARMIQLYEKLFNLTLTPTEYEEYIALKPNFNMEQLTGFLNKNIMDLKSNYERSLFLEPGYEGIIGQAEGFYNLTRERDQAFLSEMISKMEKTNESCAILITGGFHTENLKALFKEKGYSYVCVTPQVLNETNLGRYEDIILGNKTFFSSNVSTVQITTHMPTYYLSANTLVQQEDVQAYYRNILIKFGASSSNLGARLAGKNGKYQDALIQAAATSVSNTAQLLQESAKRAKKLENIENLKAQAIAMSQLGERLKQANAGELLSYAAALEKQKNKIKGYKDAVSELQKAIDLIRQDVPSMAEQKKQELKSALAQLFNSSESAIETQELNGLPSPSEIFSYVAKKFKSDIPSSATNGYADKITRINYEVTMKLSNPTFDYADKESQKEIIEKMKEMIEAYRSATSNRPGTNDEEYGPDAGARLAQISAKDFQKLNSVIVEFLGSEGLEAIPNYSDMDHARILIDLQDRLVKSLNRTKNTRLDYVRIAKSFIGSLTAERRYQKIIDSAQNDMNEVLKKTRALLNQGFSLKALYVESIKQLLEIYKNKKNDLDSGIETRISKKVFGKNQKDVAARLHEEVEDVLLKQENFFIKRGALDSTNPLTILTLSAEEMEKHLKMQLQNIPSQLPQHEKSIKNAKKRMSELISFVASDKSLPYWVYTAAFNSMVEFYQQASQELSITRDWSIGTLGARLAGTPQEKMDQILTASGLYDASGKINVADLDAKTNEYNAFVGGMRALKERTDELKFANTSPIAPVASREDEISFLKEVAQGKNNWIEFAAGRATRMKLPARFDILGIAGLSSDLLKAINIIRGDQDVAKAEVLINHQDVQTLLSKARHGILEAEGDLGFVQRHLLQLRYQYELLVSKYSELSISLEDLLKNTNYTIIANASNFDQVITQLRTIHYAGLNPANIYLVLQPEVGGYEVSADGTLTWQQTAVFPEGHGKPFIDIDKDKTVAFRLNSSGQPESSGHTLREEFMRKGVQRSLFAQVNDLHLLTDMASVTRWGAVDRLMDEGSEMVVEVVDNTQLKQKGGGTFEDENGNAFMRDTIAMKVKGEFENVAIPTTISRMLYFVSTEGLGRLDESSIPAYLSPRDYNGRKLLTYEYYSGDATSAFHKSRAVMQPGLKINTMKEQIRIPVALEEIAAQDAQPGFVDMIRSMNLLTERKPTGSRLALTANQIQWEIDNTTLPQSLKFIADSLRTNHAWERFPTTNAIDREVSAALVGQFSRYGLNNLEDINEALNRFSSNWLNALAADRVTEAIVKRSNKLGEPYVFQANFRLLGDEKSEIVINTRKLLEESDSKYLDTLIRMLVYPEDTYSQDYYDQVKQETNGTMKVGEIKAQILEMVRAISYLSRVHIDSNPMRSEPSLIADKLFKLLQEIDGPSGARLSVRKINDVIGRLESSEALGFVLMALKDNETWLRIKNESLAKEITDGFVDAEFKVSTLQEVNQTLFTSKTILDRVIRSDRKGAIDSITQSVFLKVREMSTRHAERVFNLLGMVNDTQSVLDAVKIYMSPKTNIVTENPGRSTLLAQVKEFRLLQDLIPQKSSEDLELDKKVFDVLAERRDKNDRASTVPPGARLATVGPMKGFVAATAVTFSSLCGLGGCTTEPRELAQIEQPELKDYMISTPNGTINNTASGIRITSNASGRTYAYGIANPGEIAKNTTAVSGSHDVPEGLYYWLSELTVARGDINSALLNGLISTPKEIVNARDFIAKADAILNQENLINNPSYRIAYSQDKGSIEAVGVDSRSNPSRIYLIFNEASPQNSIIAYSNYGGSGSFTLNPGSSAYNPTEFENYAQQALTFVNDILQTEPNNAFLIKFKNDLESLINPVIEITNRIDGSLSRYAYSQGREFVVGIRSSTPTKISFTFNETNPAESIIAYYNYGGSGLFTPNSDSAQFRIYANQALVYVNDLLNNDKPTGEVLNFLTNFKTELERVITLNDSYTINTGSETIESRGSGFTITSTANGRTYAYGTANPGQITEQTIASSGSHDVTEGLYYWLSQLVVARADVDSALKKGLISSPQEIANANDFIGKANTILKQESVVNAQLRRIAYSQDQGKLNVVGVTGQTGSLIYLNFNEANPQKSIIAYSSYTGSESFTLNPESGAYNPAEFINNAQQALGLLNDLLQSEPNNAFLIKFQIELNEVVALGNSGARLATSPKKIAAATVAALALMSPVKSNAEEVVPLGNFDQYYGLGKNDIDATRYAKVNFDLRPAPDQQQPVSGNISVEITSQNEKLPDAFAIRFVEKPYDQKNYREGVYYLVMFERNPNGTYSVNPRYDGLARRNDHSKAIVTVTKAEDREVAVTSFSLEEIYRHLKMGVLTEIQVNFGEAVGDLPLNKKQSGDVSVQAFVSANASGARLAVTSVDNPTRQSILAAITKSFKDAGIDETSLPVRIGITVNDNISSIRMEESLKSLPRTVKVSTVSGRREQVQFTGGFLNKPATDFDFILDATYIRSVSVEDNVLYIHVDSKVFQNLNFVNQRGSLLQVKEYVKGADSKVSPGARLAVSSNDVYSYLANVAQTAKVELRTGQQNIAVSLKPNDVSVYTLELSKNGSELIIKSRLDQRSELTRVPVQSTVRDLSGVPVAVVVSASEVITLMRQKTMAIDMALQELLSDLGTQGLVLALDTTATFGDISRDSLRFDEYVLQLARDLKKPYEYVKNISIMIEGSQSDAALARLSELVSLYPVIGEFQKRLVTSIPQDYNVHHLTTPSSFRTRIEGHRYTNVADQVEGPVVIPTSYLIAVGRASVNKSESLDARLISVARDLFGVDIVPSEYKETIMGLANFVTRIKYALREILPVDYSKWMQVAKNMITQLGSAA